MTALPAELTDELLAIGDNVDDILESIVADSTALDVFTNQVAENLIFFGKSLALWEDEMVVIIPSASPTAEELRELYVTLAEKIQIASHYHEISSAANSVSLASVDIKRADLITALVTHFHTNNIKLPASAIVEKMADSYIQRLTNLGNTSKIVKQFWRNRLDMFKSLNSIINSIGISMAVQSKGEGRDLE